ncbi:CHAD domain-containing protein [Candidatus Sumerlaeota bacterium]|nr:CHAD domain-containing protein [Candidatus Sumerlaeota bacterium]
MTSKSAITQALAEELHKHISTFDESWTGYAAARVRAETPHDQRTAVNRLKAMAQFLGAGRSRKLPGAKSLRQVRAWQKHIGPLRDLDVTRLWLAKCIALLPASKHSAAVLLDRELKAERARLLRSLRRDARGEAGRRARAELRRLERNFNALIAKFNGPKDTERALREVRQRWEKRRKALIDDHTDETLHAFRVQNKSLRYIVGFLADNGHDSLKAEAGRLDALHDILGDLSDLTVFRNTLRLRRARWSIERPRLSASAAALEAARERLEAGLFVKWFAVWPALRHAPRKRNHRG